MMATSWTRGLLVLGMGGLLIAGCAAGAFSKDETPGQRFDREMKLFAENCAKAKLRTEMGTFYIFRQSDELTRV